MAKISNKEKSLREEYDKLQDTKKDIISVLNVGKYSSTLKDLPGIGQIEIYQYEKDAENAFNDANRQINNMAKMYLGAYPELLKMDYIQDRIKDDVRKYTESLIISILTRRSMFEQNRIIDNGETGPMFRKVLNETTSEQRENVKHSDALMVNIEKFYINMAMYYESTITEKAPVPVIEVKQIEVKQIEVKQIEGKKKVEPIEIENAEKEIEEKTEEKIVEIPAPTKEVVVQTKAEKVYHSQKDMNDMIAKMQKKVQLKKDKQK